MKYMQRLNLLYPLPISDSSYSTTLKLHDVLRECSRLVREDVFHLS